MSIQKKSLISTLKTAKKAKVASAPLTHAEVSGTDIKVGMTNKAFARTNARMPAKTFAKAAARVFAKAAGRRLGRTHAKIQ
jgi:hypothetical protein